jgi:hypothetical protein
MVVTILLSGVMFNIHSIQQANSNWLKMRGIVERTSKELAS